jgi:hypothetical protein
MVRIDSHVVMSVFDLHVLDSALTSYDDVGDHQVKAISTTSGGLLNSNEARAPLLHDNRTNANVTIGSRFRGGLLDGDPFIRPTAAQHTDQPKPVLCVHHISA